MINNENEFNPKYFDKFTKLNAAMFVMFSNDIVIVPKESSWFWEL